MRVFDILSFILTVLGTSAVFLSLRLLLPYYVVQYVEARLEQTEERLNQAEAENAIPSESEYRDQFISFHDLFSQMRMASNRSPRFLEQVWLASLSCLTYKLYALYSRIGALQRDLETVIDQHQLDFIRSTIATVPLAPAAHAPETPVITVSGPMSPPPAARGLTYPPTRTEASQMSVDQRQLVSIVSDRRDVEMAIDQHQLSFMRSTIATPSHAPAANAPETPAINVSGPTSPPSAPRGLTYLPTRVDTSHMSMYQHQFVSAVSDQSATMTATALPAPTAITATRTINVAEPTPLPAARGLTHPPTLIEASQVVMDEHRHASAVSDQGAIVAALPVAGAITTTPTIQAAGPTLPLTAIRCLTHPPSLEGESQMLDEHQLASITSNQSATTAMLPPATATVA